MITRRSFLKDMLLLCAAPAIIKIERLMPVKAIVMPGDAEFWGPSIPDIFKYHQADMNRLALDLVSGGRGTPDNPEVKFDRVAFLEASDAPGWPIQRVSREELRRMMRG